jgi:hypothetical protein
MKNFLGYNGVSSDESVVLVFSKRISNKQYASRFKHTCTEDGSENDGREKMTSSEEDLLSCCSVFACFSGFEFI